MTSKQRVLIAFARQPADRVPINYEANAGIDGRLKGHFGLKADDHEGLRDILGVDFLSASFAGHWLTAYYRRHEVGPFAYVCRTGKAVDSGWPQGTDRVAVAESVAVNELLQGCLVGTVMALRPNRVRFVQGPVVENLLVYRAGREEHEPSDPSLPRGFDEPDRAHDVLLHELDEIAFTTAEPAARMVQRGVDRSLAVCDQGVGALRVIQVAGDPFK